MSLLLHILAKLIFFAVLTVLVLTLLTWLTKNEKSDKTSTPPPGEWPEDKGTYRERISTRRPYSSIRDSAKGEERRRA